ncbi:helix-turn-helix transcriptional regulator [Paenibacillus paeoniae]|uniref:XRE family transcriptional regulator n=1 Tax=Paenibacillus paeoniae TaxID=2292705 RepID=A0A371PEH6_9BACL|nr:helix-turn-helix transcriptional regulator [Paenibacillus paeoniae]REK74315.1 XRE family transcriptional regulator [Paenibacillus paeoniae]
MNSEARLHALSEFLKTKRAMLRPESFGMIAGSRRRTPGLRREEVAQLADVSLTWYTWLEQGRDIRVSPSVLNSVAKALQLNEDERKYMLTLALESDNEQPEPDIASPAVPSSLKYIIDELRHCPVIVSDRRCGIVGWNDAAAYVFLDFAEVPINERNMVKLLFARKELRRLAANWEQFAGGFLAMFRSYYGQYVKDEWYEQFISEMKAGYPDFTRLWEHSGVSYAPEVSLEFRHAQAGKMLFHLTSMQAQGSSELRCSIYTPAPGSATESKLRQRLARKESYGSHDQQHDPGEQ